MNENKSDTDILFPEVKQVAGIEIKPWSLFKIAKITPYLYRVVQGLKEQGIDVENIAENDALLIQILLPFMPEIVMITTGKTQEEIEALDSSDQIDVATSVISINMAYIATYLKNFLRVPKKQAAEKLETVGS